MPLHARGIKLHDIKRQPPKGVMGARRSTRSTAAKESSRVTRDKPKAIDRPPQYPAEFASLLGALI